MLKNILNLSGAQQLSKNEQKSINGGHNCMTPRPHPSCICSNGKWVNPPGGHLCSDIVIDPGKN